MHRRRLNRTKRRETPNIMSMSTSHDTETVGGRVLEKYCVRALLRAPAYGT